jgi:hypothetical protein
MNLCGEHAHKSKADECPYCKLVAERYELSSKLGRAEQEIERMGGELRSYTDIASETATRLSAIKQLTLDAGNSVASQVFNEIIRICEGAVERQTEDFIPASHTPDCTLPDEHKGPCGKMHM